MLAAAVVCLIPSVTAIEDVSGDLDRSADLEKGAWFGYRILLFGATRVSVDIRVSNDVDFYVFTEGMLAQFDGASGAAFPSLLALEKAHRFQHDVTQPGRIVVIDNTAKSPSGQTPDGTERFTISVRFADATPAGTTNGTLPPYVSWLWPGLLVTLIVGCEGGSPSAGMPEVGQTVSITTLREGPLGNVKVMAYEGDFLVLDGGKRIRKSRKDAKPLSFAACRQ